MGQMKRTFPMALVGFGILLLLGSGLLFRMPQLEKPMEGSLPAEIAGLPLTQKTSGEQAITEFEALHGKQFPVTSGFIGIYGSRQIILWVAGAESPDSAASMLDAMEMKIAAGNSPFTPTGQFEQEGRTVYALEGMGQSHCYFQSKKMVIWLAADPRLADRSIQQILEVYP